VITVADTTDSKSAKAEKRAAEKPVAAPWRAGIAGWLKQASYLPSWCVP